MYLLMILKKLEIHVHFVKKNVMDVNCQSNSL
jgi:hypothetical protein